MAVPVSAPLSEVNTPWDLDILELDEGLPLSWITNFKLSRLKSRQATFRDEKARCPSRTPASSQPVPVPRNVHFEIQILDNFIF